MTSKADKYGPPKGTGYKLQDNQVCTTDQDGNVWLYTYMEDFVIMQPKWNSEGELMSDKERQRVLFQPRAANSPVTASPSEHEKAK
jgi:hypothetical protein